MPPSPKLAFLNGPQDEQDYFDNLIRVQRSEYRPNGIMQRLHLSLKRKRLNCGGLGSGKTRTMCEHLNNMALRFPGGNVLLCRKDLGDLKKTAQTEYLEKVVSPETIERFNINDSTLFYRNGSKCFFMETKTPSNFKSLELIAYGVEEADENPEGEGKDRLMTMLDGRLRQEILVEGRKVPVPYAGIWTYNPVTEDHWLARLEDNPDSETEIFRSSTYDNQDNLPPDYIPNLLSTLAPWEIESLVFGHRAARPKGHPVVHGFTLESNVRPLRIFPHLHVYRSWDFGFNHPTVVIGQYDPEWRRSLEFREVLGSKEQLKFFAPKVIEATRALVGTGHPIIDICDPHGADQKDVSDSSVEYLRVHHDIHCRYQRQTIKKGLDEIQEMVLTNAPFRPLDWVPGQNLGEERRLLVDPSCKLLIGALMGGYYRGDDGAPVKDDIHDHPVDCVRYKCVHTMGLGLGRQRPKHRYQPRNYFTGY